MSDKLIKYLFFVCILLTMNSGSVLGQDFYKDYGNYLERKIKTNDPTRLKIQASIMQLVSYTKNTLSAVEKKTHVSMLKYDTLYIVVQYSLSTGKYSNLIWNKTHSCYFEGQAVTIYTNTLPEPLKIEVNASKKMDALSPVLKAIVEKADTAGFNKFIETNISPANIGLSFIKTTRSKGHWHFFFSKTYVKNFVDD